MASPLMRMRGIPRGVRMPFSNGPRAVAAFVQPTFLRQLKKSRQKKPLEGNALYSIIL